MEGVQFLPPDMLGFGVQIVDRQARQAGGLEIPTGILLSCPHINALALDKRAVAGIKTLLGVVKSPHPRNIKVIIYQHVEEVPMCLQRVIEAAKQRCRGPNLSGSGNAMRQLKQRRCDGRPAGISSIRIRT